MITLRTFNEPHYETTPTLDGMPYVFTFLYNERQDRFYLDIQGPSGAYVVKGRKLRRGVNLLRGASADERPLGLLVVMAKGSATDSPGMGELGDDGQFTLAYLPVGET